MILVCDFSGMGYIPLHTDKDIFINEILSIGDIEVLGGITVYFSDKDKNKVVHKLCNVPFRHGRIQIGYFDDVIHGSDHW